MMRQLLLACGVDGRPQSLDWLREAVRHRQPDAILFAGGVFDSIRAHAVHAPQTRLSHGEAAFLERFFQTLGELPVYSAVIPGPGDYPLEEFLKVGMNAEVEHRRVHLVHATLNEAGDTAFCGLGGTLAEIAAPGDGCSRTLAEYQLRSLGQTDAPHRVLLLSCPPPGSLGGDQGCPLAGDLIDSLHPSLCVVGGPTDHRGSQRIARTLVVNPGRLADGWAAWLDWNRPVSEQVELLNLRKLAASASADIGVGD